MAQSEIQVTTTPPLPGTQLVAEINDALETIATDFSGATDPAANAFAYSLWADTNTGNLKRRNNANSAWVTIGRIYPQVTEDSSGNVTFPATVNVGGGTLSPQTGFKNRLINGAMTIDQRNAGASVTPTADNTYTLDRYAAVLSQASKYSVQQNAGAVTPPVGFINYLGVTSLSAYSVLTGDYFAIQHKVEGLNVSDLNWGTANAQAVTLSFWARSSLTGSFGGAFRNSAGNRSYPFAYTISAANTWEYKTITVAGDTSGTWLTTNGIGIRLTFGLGAGATFSGSAGSWSGSDFISATGATSVVGTSGATFFLSGVQLEKGSTATPFEFRSIGQELGLCQRYYWQALSVGMILIPISSADVNPRNNFTFPVQMRASPTVSGSSTPGTFTVAATPTPYGFPIYSLSAGAGALATVTNIFATAEL
jgi:hypothetical protein